MISAHSASLTVGFVVDPAEKKRIDDKIKDAKVALAAIEEDMQKITDDLQGFKAEDEEYRKNHVRSFLCLKKIILRFLSPTIKSALTARKNDVKKAEAKHKSLLPKIGKLL